MSDKYVYLIGVDDVKDAATRMGDAASEMTRAANTMSEAFNQFNRDNCETIRQIQEIMTTQKPDAALIERCEKAEAEVARLTIELGQEKIGRPNEQPLLDVPLDRQIVLLNRQLAEALRENTILRGLLPKLKAPCAHCGETEIGKCTRGFPGCAQADDLMCGEDETFKRVVTERDQLKSQLAAERQKCTELEEMEKLRNDTIAKAVMTTIRSEQSEIETHLRNLLARIHRDGGQYTETHGVDKSVAAADEIVSGLHAISDDWKRALDGHNDVDEELRNRG